jgi:S1-C subfamily serine protease
VFTTWRSSVLGVEAESLGSQLAEYFGVKDGVLVRSVLKASPADKAGLKAGDVITKVDGAKVTTPGEVSGAVRSAKAKKSFAVDLVRDHHEMQMTVLLNEDRSEQSSKPRVRVVRVTGAKL